MQPVTDSVISLFIANSITVLRRFGVSAPVANDMALAIIATNRKKLSGLSIDFRRMTTAEREARKAEIRAAFNGRNHAAVCSKYKISRRTLYR
ncbi:MAG: Mor transcription activator family protein, partial [Methylococcales bacterium]